jgi:hypothetical protein
MPAPTMDATPMKAACGVEMNRRGAPLTVAVYEAAPPAGQISWVANAPSCDARRGAARPPYRSCVGWQSEGMVQA